MNADSRRARQYLRAAVNYLRAEARRHRRAGRAELAMLAETQAGQLAVVRSCECPLYYPAPERARG